MYATYELLARIRDYTRPVHYNVITTCNSKCYKSYTVAYDIKRGCVDVFPVLVIRLRFVLLAFTGYTFPDTLHRRRVSTDFKKSKKKCRTPKIHSRMHMVLASVHGFLI